METESQEGILNEEETPVSRGAYCVSVFPLMEAGCWEGGVGGELDAGLRSSENSSSLYPASVRPSC